MVKQMGGGLMTWLVALLTQRQLDDDHKKEYRIGQFDLAVGKKALERVRAEHKLTASIADAEETMATLGDEIRTLGQNIKDLDKTVADDELKMTDGMVGCPSEAGAA